MEVKIRKIPPRELHDMMRETNILILDVGSIRSAEESPRLYITGTLCCPLEELHERATHLPQDRPIVVTDILMRRSPVAARFLAFRGFEVLGVLKGGVEFWKDEGFEVVGFESTTLLHNKGNQP